MANRSVWYLVGEAIRRLVVGQLKEKQRGSQTSPQSRQLSKTKARPKLKSGTKQTRKSQEPVLHPAPDLPAGDETRDLTPAELRNVKLEYAPQPDGDPDPGEVVWTWVPYVENDGRGKDRPVLIIGRLSDTAVVGCYLSTKQHRDFISIGTGGWDSQGRESFLSPKRLLRVTETGMRREGVQISRSRFETAVKGVLEYHGVKGSGQGR